MSLFSGTGGEGHYFGGEGHNFFPSCLGEGHSFFQGFVGEGHNFFKAAGFHFLLILPLPSKKKMSRRQKQNDLYEFRLDVRYCILKEGQTDRRIQLFHYLIRIKFSSHAITRYIYEMPQ